MWVLFPDKCGNFWKNIDHHFGEHARCTTHRALFARLYSRSNRTYLISGLFKILKKNKTDTYIHGIQTVHLVTGLKHMKVPLNTIYKSQTIHYTLWLGSGREVFSSLRNVVFSGGIIGGRMPEYRTLSSCCEGGLTFMQSGTVSTLA